MRCHRDVRGALGGTACGTRAGPLTHAFRRGASAQRVWTRALLFSPALPPWQDADSMQPVGQAWGRGREGPGTDPLPDTLAKPRGGAAYPSPRALGLGNLERSEHTSGRSW